MTIWDKLSFHEIMDNLLYYGLYPQEMHDRNIENRTNMRILDEVQAMEQKLKTFKLDKEQARTEKSKLCFFSEGSLE